MPASLFKSREYQSLLTRLKQRIQGAQVRAGLAVNRELVLLYWSIGREILARQQEQGWGAKVIDALARDLRRSFPTMQGLSPRNLKYMRAFAEAWPDDAIVQQAAAQIPWFHNCVLLDKLKDPEERRWYIQQTIAHGWSRNGLVLQIESRLYQRQGRALTNFKRALPEPQSDLAQQILKDPYNFDFLTLTAETKESELERGLLDHIRQFLLELGVGAVRITDQPSIGLILCKSKDQVIVEYARRDTAKPIGIAEFRLTEKLPDDLKGSLPTIEELEAELSAGPETSDQPSGT
jgi:predicted nuclease of restriction endonuclease-like (RecB) superfamily